jgi:broad specificity phosphatase PhoE
MAATLWLARHGSRIDSTDTAWHRTAPRPFDPELSPDGRGEAGRLAARLEEANIACIFASPYLRTVETAHAVAEALDLPLRLEPALGEWLNPDWFPIRPERLPIDALAGLFPRIDRTYRSRGDPSYPETEEQAMERCAAAARRLTAAEAGSILLVGHGVTVFGILRGLAGIQSMDCRPCSLSKLVRRAGDWTVELCGDCAHL